PTPLPGLHRSYGSVRPSAPHRYARLVASTTCTSPLALKRLVPAVPFESLCQIHAPFTPVAACPVFRAPDRLFPEVPLASGFDDTLILTTRQRKVNWTPDVTNPPAEPGAFIM